MAKDKATKRDDPNKPQGTVSAVTQGALVEVYWPDDDAWYRGKVGKIDFDWKTTLAAEIKKSKGKDDGTKMEGPYRVDYADGDKEWLDLKKERWTLIEADASKKPSSMKKSAKATKPEEDEKAQLAPEKKKAAEREKKTSEKKGAAAEPDAAGSEPEAAVKAAEATLKASKAKGKSKAAKAEEKAAEKDEATGVEVDEAGEGKDEGADGAGNTEAAPSEEKSKAPARKRKSQAEAADGADAGKGKGRDAKKPATAKTTGKAVAAPGSPKPASPKPRKSDAQGVFSTNAPWEALRGMKGGKPKPELLLQDEAMFKIYDTDSKEDYEVFFLIHHMSADEINVRCWSNGRVVIIRAPPGTKEKERTGGAPSKTFDFFLPGRIVPDRARAMLCSHGQLHLRVKKAEPEENEPAKEDDAKDE